MIRTLGLLYALNKLQLKLCVDENTMAMIRVFCMFHFMYYLLNELFTFSVVGAFFSCIVISLWSTESDSYLKKRRF